MTQEALRMALEALITASGHLNNEAFVKVMMARDAVVEALAQPEQEPFAWGVDWGKAGDIACVSIIKRLPNDVIEVVAVEYAPYSYTHPPQRTWIGLTEQERNDIEDYCEMMIGKPAFDAIEAKLKQKNGYAEEENT